MAWTQRGQDLFTDTNDTPLESHTPDSPTGASWTAFHGTDNLVITNNGLRLRNEVPDHAIFSVTLAAKQAVQGLVNNRGTQPTLLLRSALSGGNLTGYLVRVTSTGGHIEKFTGSGKNKTTLASNATAWQNGDTFRFEADGSTLSLYRNGSGTPDLTTEDSTYTSGKAGTGGIFASATLKHLDSFVVEDEAAVDPPVTPSNPNPADTATGVLTTLALSWSSSGATSFDIFLDTENPPVTQVETDHPTASYNVSGLTASTQYYWKIIARNAGGDTEGPVWTFTTGNTPIPPNTTRDTIQKPLLPTLEGAGYKFVDPAFGSQMVRVTDANTGLTVGQGANRSYRSPSASTQRAWNADSTRFYVVDTHGNTHPYNWDPETMTPTQLGSAVLTISGEPAFHDSDPDLIYGKHGNRTIKVQDLSVSPPSLTTVVNLDDIIEGLAELNGGNTFMGGFSLQNDTLVVSAGGASQDQHFYCVWYPLSSPENVKVINTLTAVDPETGVPFNSGNGFKLHSTFMDLSGRYVVMEVANLSNDPVDSYIWDTTLDTITPASLFMAGHRALGHGVMVNNESSGGSWDAAQWTFRNLATPDSSLRNLISPVNTPQQVYLADHPSWNNALPTGPLQPFLTATYRYYVGTLNNVYRSWDDEILRVTTIDGLSMVERFAHHRSDVSKDSGSGPFEFWYLPRANVSPNGQWVLFTSNWEKTLGTDAVEGIARQDAFIVALEEVVSLPTIITTSLSLGEVGVAYDKTVEAFGGTPPYVFTIDSGALPTGLTLETDGQIHGTPTEAGLFNFVVLVTDDASNTDTQGLSINIVVLDELPERIKSIFDQFLTADMVPGDPRPGA